MKHKRKSKKDKNLVYIEKINEDESSLIVALKVISMYENDYNLTLTKIASIFKCERQWVTKYVQDNVKHIFLNDRYRAYLMEVDKTRSINEKGLYLKDYYYFSRVDFFRWLKNNTVATRQAQRMDINIYSADFSEFKRITNEYREVLKKAKNYISVGMATMDYENNLEKTLIPFGQKVFSKRLGVTNRKNTKEVRIKNFELPEGFTSIKELKKDCGKSLEIVYRDLFRCGAIKYTIAESLVRYDNNPTMDYEESDYPYAITIPYEYYIKEVTKIKKKGE